MGLMDDIITRTARVGATHASKRMPGPKGPAAARKDDPIQHSSFLAALAGAVTGALISAAIFGAAALFVAGTGGLGATLLVAAVGTAGTFALGEMIGKASSAVTNMVNSFCSPDGLLDSGSSNVKIEGKPAARATVDVAKCSKHPTPPLIAQGSETVFINGQPAARVDDKLVCGAVIKGGASTVFIGSGQGSYLKVEEEFSLLERALLVAVEYLVPPTRGGLKAAGKLFSQKGRQVLTRAALKDARALAREAKTVVAGAKLGAKSAKQWAKSVMKNPKAAAGKALSGAKNGAKKAAGNVKAGTHKALKGAKTGASKAGSKIKRDYNQRVECAKQAFRETKGAKRYWEAGKRFFTKDPIDVATGALFDQRIDLALGQTLPLTFLRSWVPGARGLLGENWADSFSGRAVVIGDRVEIQTTEGASLYFILTPADRSSMNPEHPQFTLCRADSGYVLHERNNPVSQHFSVRVPADEDSPQWQLGALSDPFGNTIAFHYSEQHQLVKVTHSDGPALVLLYRNDGLLAEIRRTDNGLNAVMARYGYHENGWLADADSTQHFHLFYDYNAQGLISRWHDGDQTAVDYRYDAQGRCIYTVGSGGYYPGVLEYEPGLTRVINPDGHITTWRHNDQQLVTQEETPCGHVTRFEYDDWGNLRRKILPEGQILTLDYLADTGLVTAFTEATGATWCYQYDEADRLISMTDPLGRVWQQHYDDRGNAECFIAPDGSKTTLTRNEFGLVIAAEDDEGRKRTWEYDGHQRLTKLFDEEHRSLRLGYDSHDRLQRFTSGGGALWLWEYDRHHRVSLSDRPNNSLERFGHDRHGNLTEWTDARGVNWHIEYGPFDLPVARVDGEGNRWQYRYDLNSLQLLEVVNPQGESYRYTLDADGRVVTETDYAGTRWHYAYDGNGHCIEKRDALDQVTRYEYDAAGRMIAMHTPEGTTTYRYDILGRLREVAGPDGAPLTFDYDDQDRQIKEVQPHGDITRDYPDSATAESTFRAPDGRCWQAKTQANKVGELRLLSISGGHTLRLERDEDGQEWHRQSDKGFILRQAHSLMGQLTAQRAGRNTEFFAAHEVADIPQPTLAGLDREYRYDAALNLVAANDERQWLGYVVNGNGQVTSVSDGDRLREHYQYDGSGYPSRRFDGLNEIDGERIYQKGHRLRRLGQHLFEYDDAGRMTAMQLWQEGHRPQLTKLRWNSQNQLTGVLTPGGQRWEYRYDAFGRRTEKVCEQAGSRTTYLWDGDVPAEIREYRHNRLYSIRHLVFDGWQLLAQQVQFFTPNPENRSELLAGEIQTQYAVCAPTGEPLALFDEAGHRVWRQPPHSLYGLRLGVPGENAELDPGMQFAGQWLDEESGLVYNRFRYYSPVASCYLTPDPL
uniref:PAAR domain-containing protein n=1 Tax=Xenorhabdus beddingii TaxID=40578 RepID=UPI000A326751